MYSIVEFITTKEVEVVPESWILSDGKCWWPNFRSKVKKCVMTKAVPDRDNYLRFEIRVLKSYESYNAARMNLNRSVYDSDLNSEPESPNRRRGFRPHRLFSETEDEPRAKVPRFTLVTPSPDRSRTQQVSQSCPVMPPPPKSLAKCVKEKSYTPTTSFVTADEPTTSVPPSFLPTQNTPETSATVLPSALEPTTPNQRFPASSSLQNHAAAGILTDAAPRSMTANEFQAWMIRNVGILKAQVRQLQETTDAILKNQSQGSVASNTSTTSIKLADHDIHLPLPNSERLEQFLSKVKDKSCYELVVSKLALRGCSKVSSCVRRVLAGLLKDAVAIQFNWIGSRGEKQGFQTSILKQIVDDATRKCCPTAKDAEIEGVVKEWLKNAKKRLTYIGRKSRSTNATTEGAADSEIDGES